MIDQLNSRIDHDLRLYADEQYNQFNSGLVKATLPTIGVRVPQIRCIAKQYAQKTDFDFDCYFTHFSPVTFDQQMFSVFLLSALKISFAQQLAYLKEMIPTFDNWAVVDSFCSSFKQVLKHKEDMLVFLKPYINGGEFEQRMVAVMLMDYYIDETYLPAVEDILPKLKCSAYYTRMAVAWATATIAAKNMPSALRLLDGRLDEWTHNKAIQKARESYRISDRDKSVLSSLKRR